MVEETGKKKNQGEKTEREKRRGKRGEDRK